MIDDENLNSINPLELLNSWLEDAKSHSGMDYSNAMVLSTISPEGTPSSRVVLVKQWDTRGITFFTNYTSKKGLNIESNNTVCANFYWDKMQKQIKIVGTAEKTPRKTSEDYWNTRPRDSQISQFLSQQSKPVESKEQLEQKKRNIENEFKDKDVPCPEHWGGYLIKPTTIEFWVGQPARLHDRFQYELQNGQWLGQRLYP